MFLSHCSPGMNIDNNAILVPAEAQKSVLTETQLAPTSLQGEPQMSASLKCYAKMHSHSQHILYDFTNSLTLQVDLHMLYIKLTQIMYKCRMCSFSISHTHIFNDGWEKFL